MGTAGTPLGRVGNPGISLDLALPALPCMEMQLKHLDYPAQPRAEKKI
jgi:hypothetical protein